MATLYHPVNRNRIYSHEHYQSSLHIRLIWCEQPSQSHGHLSRTLPTLIPLISTQVIKPPTPQTHSLTIQTSIRNKISINKDIPFELRECDTKVHWHDGDSVCLDEGFSVD